MDGQLEFIHAIPLAAAVLNKQGELSAANAGFHQIIGSKKRVLKDTLQILSSLPADHIPHQVTLPSGSTMFAVSGRQDDHVMVLLCPFEHFPREIGLAGLLFSHAKDGIVIIDSTHKVVAANPQFCSMLGYSHDEITQLYSWDYAVEYDEAGIKEAFQNPKDMRRVFVSEHLRKDGSSYPVEVSMTGIPSGLFLCICRDLTEQRALEAEKHAAFRLMQETLHRIQDAFISLDPSLRFTYVNPRGADFCAESEEGLLGRSILETPPFSELKDFRDMLYSTSRLGESGARELYIPSRNQWIELWIYPSEEGYSIFFHDITDRKTNQRSIYYQLAFQKLLTECSSNLIQASEEHFTKELKYFLKQFGSFLAVDRSLLVLFDKYRDTLQDCYQWCAPGISHTRELGRDLDIRDFSSWMDRLKEGKPVIVDDAQQLPEDYGTRELEYLSKHSISSMLCYPILEGTILTGLLWFETVTRVCRWKPDGRALFPLAANILAETLRKHLTQLELSEERRRLQNIITGTNAGTWEWDLEAQTMQVNSQWYALAGHPKDSPYIVIQDSDNWRKDYHPDDVEQSQRLMQEHLQGIRPFYHWEGRIRHRKGHWIWVVDRGSVVSKDSQGKPRMVSGTRQDITERKQTEELMRYIIEHTNSCIAVHDRDMRYIFVSQRYLDAFGITSDQVIGRHHYDVTPDLPEKFREAHRRCLDGEVLSQEDDSYPREDGTVEWTNWECRPWYESDGSVGGVIVYTEITTQRKEAEQQRMQLQEQLAQANKMESVGRLAGGIAHDFNNMLQAIIGHGELALDQLEESHPVREDVTVILEAARKSADLTRQLLAYARKQTIQPKVLDINHAVSSILPMIKRVIGSDISLTWQPGKNLPPICMDPAQMDQVLLNLCVNARDAVKQHGSITISTKSHTDETGSYAQLTVSDTGNGIDQDLLPYVFEPFFTTKDVGKGTGLGLPMVYGMVTQNKGTITLDSRIGEGTDAVIRFPSCLKDASLQHPQKQVKRTYKRTLNILLVDDDPDVLKPVHSLLKSLGHAIAVEPSPQKLLSTFDPASQVDLLITDVVMPGIDGVGLAKKLQEYQPRLQVLFISGYSAEALNDRGLEEAGYHFLQKPFTRKGLEEKIQSIF